jgi:hypothetical protein
MARLTFFGGVNEIGGNEAKQQRTEKDPILSEQFQQSKLNFFPSEIQKEPLRKSKQIVINKIVSVTKYDEMALNVEFKLIPSKLNFSKLRSTLFFDDQEVKSALIRIPQGFGESDEFQLNYVLDMRGISAGTHTTKVELHDLFSSCSSTKKEKIEYVPIDRKALYRKIPIAKKIAGEDLEILSKSDEKIYRDISKAIRNELDSKQDKW